MKITYGVAVVVLLFGLWLLTFGMSDGEQTSLLGLTFNTQLGRGIGIVSIIFSIIAFLVAYGSSLPPARTNRHS
ncbi:MAG TPA: hypothetical protein VNN62_14225 [Methylomirabilota bacterium]|jgi:hypothetical protein|nr:hypothetical protein [Methylomirabilota bacterium]